MMTYQILCNGVPPEGAKCSPALASELFCSVPLHKIWYGVQPGTFTQLTVHTPSSTTQHTVTAACLCVHG
jgi:hypothetical protein